MKRCELAMILPSPTTSGTFTHLNAENLSEVRRDVIHIEMKAKVGSPLRKNILLTDKGPHTCNYDKVST